jgi:hypothetical protein
MTMPAFQVEPPSRGYWIVRGPVPFAVALRVHSHPVGRRHVRVNGDCTCPAPTLTHGPGGAEFRNAFGQLVIDDPDGIQEQAVDDAIKRGMLSEFSRPRFSRDAAKEAEAFITLYHVDTAEALDLLALCLREHILECERKAAELRETRGA